MEPWVRVQNEHDRRVLAWLRDHVGDLAIIEAVRQCDVGRGKPYLSAVCRKLGITVPRSALGVSPPGKVGERYLADIYQILQRSAVPLHRMRSFKGVYQ